LGDVQLLGGPGEVAALRGDQKRMQGGREDMASMTFNRLLPLPADRSMSPCSGHVGASLLAKTVSHSALMLADPALSRAGSLPQGICVFS
jgi:hypothetical protein